jgi:hypothetical protein
MQDLIRILGVTWTFFVLTVNKQFNVNLWYDK